MPSTKKPSEFNDNNSVADSSINEPQKRRRGLYYTSNVPDSFYQTGFILLRYIANIACLDQGGLEGWTDLLDFGPYLPSQATLARSGGMDVTQNPKWLEDSRQADKVEVGR